MKREPRRGLAELTQLLAWAHEKRIRPLVTGTCSLEHAHAALAAVLEHRAVGKLLITMR